MSHDNVIQFPPGGKDAVNPDEPDWKTIPDMLRCLIRDIESGVLAPDAAFVAMRQCGVLDGQPAMRLPHYLMGCNQLEVIGLLESHKQKFI